jgi:hypothetical protein
MTFQLASAAEVRNRKRAEWRSRLKHRKTRPWI